MTLSRRAFLVGLPFAAGAGCTVNIGGGDNSDEYPDETTPEKIGRETVESLDELSNSALDAAKEVDWEEKGHKAGEAAREAGEGFLEFVKGLLEEPDPSP